MLLLCSKLEAQRLLASFDDGSFPGRPWNNLSFVSLADSKKQYLIVLFCHHFELHYISLIDIVSLIRSTKINTYIISQIYYIFRLEFFFFIIIYFLLHRHTYECEVKLTKYIPNHMYTFNKVCSKDCEKSFIKFIKQDLFLFNFFLSRFQRHRSKKQPTKTNSKFI